MERTRIAKRSVLYLWQFKNGIRWKILSDSVSWLLEKGYSYKRKDGGLTITLADYPDFKKRYITLSGVNLARIAGDPSRLSLTDLSPEGLVMQEQAFLDELEQLGLLEIEDSVKWKMHRLDITQDFYVKCDPSLMVKIIRYAGSVDPYRKGRALHYNQHNEIRSCKFEKTWYDFALYDKHQQLLNCEKESYPISPDDLERSKIWFDMKFN